MKKYLISISGLTDLEFSLPVLKGRKSEILSKILLSLGVLSFFLMMFILPFSNLFTGKSSEQSTFEVLVAFITLCLGFFGSFFLLQGKKVIVDPRYFLSVLFFALLTTAASVLKSPAHISNTFGINTVRSLSGITIMALVGFFYFFNFIAKDFKMLSRIYKVLHAGLAVLIVVLIFHTNVTDVNFVNNNLAPVLFTYFYLLIILVFSKSRIVLKSILLAVSAIFVFLVPQTIPDTTLSTRAIATGILTIFIVGVIYSLVKREYIKDKISELKQIQKSFKEKKYSMSEVSYFLLLGASIVAILVGVLVHFRFNFISSTLNVPLDSFLSALKSPFSTNLNISTLLLGNGSYNAVSKISYLNPGNTTMVNIIVTQGLVGLTAYLFIFISAFRALAKAIKRSLVERNKRGFVFTLAFVIIYISLYTMFAYVGEFFTILWWLAFASLAAYLHITDLKKVFIQEDWSVKKLILKNKAGVYLRVIISVLIAVASFAALISFSKISV